MDRSKGLESWLMFTSLLIWQCHQWNK